MRAGSISGYIRVEGVYIPFREKALNTLSLQVKYEVIQMSDHYNDTFGQCDNCQLESRLYGGICEDCDSEYFAEFWTGDEEEL